MTEWHTRKLVVVNGVYDRDSASDGRSRYGAYLRQHAEDFRDGWTDRPTPIQDPAEFAVHAWRVATAPVMVPGYVQIRPDLRSVTLHRDEDDGGLYADIRIPLPHSHISHIGGHTKRFPYTWQDWEAERSYEDTAFHRLVEPRSTKRPSVLAEVTVRVPGGAWAGLPTPTAYEGTVLLEEARDAVSTVVAYINEDAGPMVETILRLAVRA